VAGRPILVTRVGSGPTKIVWIVGIHGDEPEGAASADGLSQMVADDPGLSARVTAVVVKDANPDGRAANTRTNANGVDLNRNFPATDFDSTNPGFGRSPLSQPESLLLHDLVVNERPNVVVSCHAWRGAAFINFDGPAERLATVLSTSSRMPLRPSNQLGESTPGSLGSWLGRDLEVATITIEWPRGTEANGDWIAIRPAVVALLRDL
jgi:hypothetical protein